MSALPALILSLAGFVAVARADGSRTFAADVALDARRSVAFAADVAPGADGGGGRGALVEVGRPPRVPTALDSVPHPWPGVALVLSATGTALPIVLADAGNRREHDPRIALAALGAEVLTPAVGHLYAGLDRRAAIGIGVRAAGYAIVAGGAWSVGYWSGETSSEITWGHLVVLSGAAVIAGSALWDVITAPTDVERRNADWLRAHVSLDTRTLPGGRGPALAMSVRF